MKSYATIALVATFGVVAIVFADSSAKTSDQSNSDASSPRFSIHGEGDNRLMFDSQTGDTWIMKTALRATMEADPSPIVVWFPVPRADRKFSETVLRSRLSQLKYFRDAELDEAKRHVTEQEREQGSDHPDVLAAHKELENAADAYGVVEEDLLLPLFAR